MRKTVKWILGISVIFSVFWITPYDLLSQDEEGGTPPKKTSVITITNQAKDKETKSPAQIFEEERFDPFSRPSITTQAVVLSGLAMMPFIVMILTSFMKIVIVLSLLRSALGVQQSPPNQIINGVAFMLSLFVMYPTAIKMYDAAKEEINLASQQEEPLLSKSTSSYFLKIADKAKDPLKDFLKRNSAVAHQALFYKMAYRVIPPDYRGNLSPEDFMILVPAFITSQLRDAFQIGVLIYIPFFVIDLVTSNILLAMGMMMLSPVTISMPLKLFLLVMLDGWTLLVQGLVQSYK